jgi:hypothetical protein
VRLELGCIRRSGAAAARPGRRRSWRFQGETITRSGCPLFHTSQFWLQIKRKKENKIKGKEKKRKKNKRKEKERKMTKPDSKELVVSLKDLDLTPDS